MILVKDGLWPLNSYQNKEPFGEEEEKLSNELTGPSDGCERTAAIK